MSTEKLMHQVDIVLASASPGRHVLLQQISVNSMVHAVELDESPLADEKPETYVQRLALAKAKQAYAEIKRSLPVNKSPLPVLGSDTTVTIAGEILGKPDDSTHATQMLAKLSGKSHFVLTAVALVTPDAVFQSLSRTQVCFAHLSAEYIALYVSTGEPLNKAGAYAIQGQAAQFIQWIQGSYSGVMGLPLYETTELLLRANINPLTLSIDR